jgi:hypothetical protein
LRKNQPENPKKFLNHISRKAEVYLYGILEKAMTPFLPSGPGLLQGLFLPESTATGLRTSMIFLKTLLIF